MANDITENAEGPAPELEEKKEPATGLGIIGGGLAGLATMFGLSKRAGRKTIEALAAGGEGAKELEAALPELAKDIKDPKGKFAEALNSDAVTQAVAGEAKAAKDALQEVGKAERAYVKAGGTIAADAKYTAVVRRHAKDLQDAEKALAAKEKLLDKAKALVGKAKDKAATKAAEKGVATAEKELEQAGKALGKLTESGPKIPKIKATGKLKEAGEALKTSMGEAHTASESLKVAKNSNAAKNMSKFLNVKENFGRMTGSQKGMAIVGGLVALGAIYYGASRMFARRVEQEREQGAAAAPAR